MSDDVSTEAVAPEQEPVSSEALSQEVEDVLEALRDGDVDSLVVQDPYRMGYFGVWMLVQHLEGKTVAPGQPYISTGEYLLTRENIDSEESRQRFDPEAQQRRTIALPELRGR